jgi:membrane protein
MIQKIKTFLKTYHSLTKTYHPALLARAIVFYILMVILPLGGLVLYILGSLSIEVDGYPDLFGAIGNPRVSIVSSIILFFNLLWVSSQLTDTLNIVSDVVYTDVKKRIFWKRRIYSFLITLLLVFIIVVEIIAFLVVSFLIKRLANNQIFYQYPLLLSAIHILQILIQFVGIWILTSFVYKYVIPVKVKLSAVLKSCLGVTIVWFTMTFLYQSFFVSFQQEAYTVLYGALANIFLFLLWLYAISYVFIAGLIFNYYLYRKQ